MMCERQLAESKESGPHTPMKGLVAPRTVICREPPARRSPQHDAAGGHLHMMPARRSSTPDHAGQGFVYVVLTVVKNSTA